MASSMDIDAITGLIIRLTIKETMLTVSHLLKYGCCGVRGSETHGCFRMASAARPVFRPAMEGFLEQPQPGCERPRRRTMAHR